MKNEKMRIEHEKNLMDIQLKKLEDVIQNQLNEKEELMSKIQEFDDTFQ